LVGGKNTHQSCHWCFQNPLQVAQADPHIILQPYWNNFWMLFYCYIMGGLWIWHLQVWTPWV
jgi:hypothetical protein